MCRALACHIAYLWYIQENGRLKPPLPNRTRTFSMGRGEFSRPGIIYKFLYLKKRVCIMKKVRVHLLIKGRVQGVFFRATLRDLALRLGINGWVRNLWGSGVEATLEGEEKQVKEMIDWSHQGPPGARVDEVEVDWEKHQGEFKSFSIRY